MRELFFKEAIEKYGASTKCDLTFEMRIVRADDIDGTPLTVLGEVKTNCGHDAFLQLKKEYATEVKKYGPSAMFELSVK